MSKAAAMKRPAGRWFIHRLVFRCTLDGVEAHRSLDVYGIRDRSGVGDELTFIAPGPTVAPDAVPSAIGPPFEFNAIRGGPSLPGFGEDAKLNVQTYALLLALAVRHRQGESLHLGEVTTRLPGWEAVSSPDSRLARAEDILGDVFLVARDGTQRTRSWAFKAGIDVQIAGGPTSLENLVDWLGLSMESASSARRSGAQSVTPASTERSLPPTNLPPPPTGIVVRFAKVREIEEALSGGGSVCVVGLPGSGKTTLALSVAHQLSSQFVGGVWYIRASGPAASAVAMLRDSLQALGPPSMRSQLARLPSHPGAEATAEVIRLTLENLSEPTLLVLDGIDTPGWRRYLPRGRVQTLATTIDRGTAHAECIVRSGLFSSDEVDNLCRIAGAAPSGEHEVAAMRRVTDDVLGRHPLSVALAARAIGCWPVSWSEYERTLRHRWKELQDDARASGDYEKGADAAIDVTLARCEIDDGARALLRAIALLDLPSMPSLKLAAIAMGEPYDATFSRALRMLADHSVVERYDVREERLAHIALERIPAARELMLEELSQQIGPREGLSVHTLILRRAKARLLADQGPDVSSVLRRYARTISERADSSTAGWPGEPVSDIALQVARLWLPPVEQFHLLQDLSKLAEPRERTSLLQDAVRVGEGAFGPSSEEVLDCLMRLGHISPWPGWDLEAALAAQERALRIVEKRGAAGDRVPPVVRQLARLYEFAGRLFDAHVNYQRLSTDAGSQDAFPAEARIAAARIAKELGFWNIALARYDEALATESPDLESFHEDHLFEAAHLALKAGELDSAPVVSHAAATVRRGIANSFRKDAEAFMRYAVWASRLVGHRHRAKTIGLLRTAARLSQKVMSSPADHPIDDNVSFGAGHAGEIGRELLRQGLGEEAESYFRSVLGLFPPNEKTRYAEEIATMKLLLAERLTARGECVEGLSLVRDVLAEVTAEFDPCLHDHRKRAEASLACLEILVDLNCMSEAGRLADRLVNTYRETRWSFQLGKSLVLRALILARNGSFSEANQDIEEAIAVTQELDDAQLRCRVRVIGLALATKATVDEPHSRHLSALRRELSNARNRAPHYMDAVLRTVESACLQAEVPSSVLAAILVGYD